MKRKRVLGIFVALLVIVGLVMPIFTNVMAQPPIPKNVKGDVIPNSVTGVRAFDPVKNGVVAFYIQNRTNNGTHMELMKYADPPIDADYYLNAIHEGIDMWLVGDPGIVVVSVENGTTAGGDRAGYVAYLNETLDMSDPQIFKDTELMKIPVPMLDINGTNFIQFTWTPLPDPWGLIAGYTIYRSTDNETWNLHQDVSADNPVTGAMFNDTKVSPGSTYYYALKVVFVGYEFDNPANVDNYECVFPGEGSGLMNSTSVDWVINEIRITNGPNGTNLGDPTPEYLNIGESIQATASAYNNTFGFWGVIEVEWTQAPTLGVLNPGINPDTTFTAGFAGGAPTITALNTSLGLSDTFDIIIRDPTVDYIDLTDAPAGNPLDLVERTVDEQLTIYASGYNNTGNTYVRLVEVNWTEDGGIGGFLATPGTSAVYTGTDPGLTNITGMATPLVDTFIMRIYGVPKEVDYIEITDAPNGNNVTDVDLGVGEQITVYASGYNLTTGYYGLVKVDWTITLGGTLGSLAPASGNSTTFTAGLTDGLVKIDGTNYYVSSITDMFNITILPPTVDYVLIRSAPDGGGLDLTNSSNYPSYPVGHSTILYGAAYNTTSGYIDIVSATSTWVSSGAIVVVTSPGDQTTITCSDTESGTITLTLDDGGLTATTDITVLTPTADSIEIHDAATGGIVIGTMTYGILETDTFYAIGFNVTAGNIGIVSVDWESDTPSVGAVTPTGTSTTLTAQNISATGTCIVTATYAPGIVISTGDLTVLAPTIDYIQIEDAAGGYANEITTDSFDLAGTYQRNYYCAGYNNTEVWVGDVDGAEWNVATIGSVNPTSGNLVQFTATAAGTADLTATSDSMSATVSITVTGVVDTTAPATPTGFSVATVSGATSLDLSWTATPDTDGDLAGYNIYRSTTGDTGDFTKINTVPIAGTSYQDTGLTAETKYYYYITAVDDSGNESPGTAVEQQTVPAIGAADDDEDGFPIIIPLLLIIIIIVILLLFFLMKRKKPEGEPALPEEEAPPEEELPPPEEEAPPEEEEMPEEEEPSEAPEGEAEGLEGEEQAEERELPPPP